MFRRRREEHMPPNGVCCTLDVKRPHRFMHLNTWSPGGGDVWEDYGMSYFILTLCCRYPGAAETQLRGHRAKTEAGSPQWFLVSSLDTWAPPVYHRVRESVRNQGSGVCVCVCLSFIFPSTGLMTAWGWQSVKDRSKWLRNVGAGNSSYTSIVTAKRSQDVG